MRVAVAGGTGLVGKLTVGALREAGHEPVVLARSRGVDVTNGSGLTEALAGCEAVIDVTNVVSLRRKTSVDFFSRAAANLLAAARGAGARHLVALSIVNCDRVGLGYYYGKRAQEELVRTGDVPWTVLRATQFFEFPEPLLAGRSPVVPVPNMLTRPVAAADVAEALAGIAVGAPLGMARDLAGPDQLGMLDMTRRTARARRRRRLVLPVSLPGATGRQLAGGGLLPLGEYTTGRRTFDEHVAALTTTAAP